MDILKQKKLNQDFPELLRGHLGYAINFECLDGWYDLLYKLFQDIMRVSKQEKYRIGFSEKKDDPGMTIVQVKEKYGTLRIYTNFSYEEIDKLIDRAEHASETICEVCGKEGKLKCENRWYLVRCKDCK